MLVAVPPENRPRMCGMHSRPLKHPFDGGSVGVSLSQSWRDLLLDLKRRGLATASQIAVADGALRFWKALGEVWPTTRERGKELNSGSSYRKSPRECRTPTTERNPRLRIATFARSLLKRDQWLPSMGQHVSWTGDREN